MSRGGYVLIAVGICGWLIFLFHDAVVTSTQRDAFQKQENSQEVSSLQQESVPTNSGVSVDFSASTQPTAIQKTYDIFVRTGQQTGEISSSMLEKLYDQSKDPQIGRTLISQLLKEYEFVKAYDVYKTLQTTASFSLDPHTYLYMFLHSPEISVTQPSSIEKFRQQVITFTDAKQLSSDDQNFYFGLIDLWNGDMTHARSQFVNAKNSSKQVIVQALQNTFDQVDAQKDVPDTYRQSLIALTLLKNGYFTVAKKMALQVVLQDDSYILPYQILAYADFLTHQPSSSIEYFLKLLRLDPSQKDMYTFFVGIAYYSKKDYENALLYLRQVTQPALVADVARYSILLYADLENYPKQIEAWQELLAQTSFSDADMYGYVYDTFWKPFRTDSSYDLFRLNPQLAQIMITQCPQKVKNSDICSLGELGMMVAKNQRTGVEEKVLPLIKTYNTSYLLHLLGDVASRKNDSQNAQRLYAQAISQSDNADEKRILQDKLLNITTPTSFSGISSSER